jgi:hypothetical protein
MPPTSVGGTVQHPATVSELDAFRRESSGEGDGVLSCPGAVPMNALFVIADLAALVKVGVVGMA